MKRLFSCQNKVGSSDCVPSTESFHSRYMVKRIIGEGGYGKVYEGIRISDGKKVAIKYIEKSTRNQYLQTDLHPEPLFNEVALMLVMRQGKISPLIIQLYEWFEDPKEFTLIMEYPDPCESLLDFINDNPSMNETTARRIMCQAVRAVQHCIKRGVFHNDIHPDNFLLRKHTLELKLIDFGCGQLFSSDGYDSMQYRGELAFCVQTNI
ncbi:serine/threonine-protein kinase pim-2-like [Puntigrus tetrazona]|uniref:serine/threonine-protein kinase pim-2-like n=1 Tax=Puntigrus tetrazona TaxID=1606681 RepID=UPI001C89165F|nr:serine/threonine-protein kinase pim-2-like [Puntigrus tetrazona]